MTAGMKKVAGFLGALTALLTTAVGLFKVVQELWPEAQAKSPERSQPSVERPPQGSPEQPPHAPPPPPPATCLDCSHSWSECSQGVCLLARPARFRAKAWAVRFSETQYGSPRAEGLVLCLRRLDSAPSVCSKGLDLRDVANDVGYVVNEQALELSGEELMQGRYEVEGRHPVDGRVQGRGVLQRIEATERLFKGGLKVPVNQGLIKEILLKIEPVR